MLTRYITTHYKNKCSRIAYYMLQAEESKRYFLDVLKMEQGQNLHTQERQSALRISPGRVDNRKHSSPKGLPCLLQVGLQQALGDEVSVDFLIGADAVLRCLAPYAQCLARLTFQMAFYKMDAYKKEPS